MEEPEVGRQHLHLGAHGFNKPSLWDIRKQGCVALAWDMEPTAIRRWELERPSSEQTLSL